MIGHGQRRVRLHTAFFTQASEAKGVFTGTRDHTHLSDYQFIGTPVLLLRMNLKTGYFSPVPERFTASLANGLVSY